MRYYIAVKENVFIPQKTRACSTHINTGSWENVIQLMNNEHYDFVKEYIEDMFKLLSNPPLKIGAAKELS